MRASLSLAVIAACLGSSSALSQPGPPPPLPPPPVPAGNPITAAKVNLGKVLFWDEQISSTRTVACGTCHIPAVGGSDPRSQSNGPISLNPGFDGQFGTNDDVRGSPGVVLNDAAGFYLNQAPFDLRPQVTGRKAPTMINAAYAPSLFWDGRADGSFEDPLTGVTILPDLAALESQAAGPPLSTGEMGHVGRDWNDVATRIEGATPLVLAEGVPGALDAWIAGRTYPQLFLEAFGSAQVTPARIIMAIATYERILIANAAPIDQPPMPPALTPLEQQGRQVFNGPGRCFICHGGPNFTDNLFHNIGVRPIFEDLGLGGITGNPPQNGRFRTPTLRNVGLRAPYFHNGSKATLMDVVDFYDRGGDFHVNQDPAIIPLGLTPQEKNALVAFLGGALTDPRVAAQLPPFDRPTLYAESNRVPNQFRVGNAGTGGFIPVWTAVEPPVLGNPNLTFAMDQGLGGALTLLALDTAISPPGTNVNGVPFHLAATASLAFIPFVLPGAGPGEGWASFVSPVPSNPALDGLPVILQAFVADPAAIGGYAATRGLEFVFFSG